MLTDYINELRWIELESGTAVVQRSWMEGEAETTASWANICNYYLGITYTTPEGTDTVAAWAALYLAIPLPKDVTKAKRLMQSRRNGTDPTNYLNENMYLSLHGRHLICWL